MAPKASCSLRLKGTRDSRCLRRSEREKSAFLQAGCVCFFVFEVMGYRQCLLRGLKSVQGEWNLVAMSWNIKRMFAMQPC